MLTNREIATIILFGVLFAWALSREKTRESFLQLIISVTNLKLLILIGIYLMHACLLVGVAWHLGFWKASLLKDTLLVVLVSGMGMVISANTIKSGTSLLRKTARDTIGLTAVITFYVNLSSFSVPIEILAQSILALVSILSVLAKHQKNTKHNLSVLFDTFLVIGGVCLLIKTTVDLQTIWRAEGPSGVLGPLLLSIWFPILLLPFVYTLSFLMHLEGILIGLKALNGQKPIRLRAFISLLIGLRFSVKYASLFTGYWRNMFLEQDEIRKHLATMSTFRKDILNRETEERLEVRRQKQFAGSNEEDEHGKRLDRREFKETCRLLTDLYFSQRGVYGNSNQYFETPLIFLNESKYYGLSENRALAVTALVSRNKRSWYAWRSTPSGWVFAVGGTNDFEKQWYYDGPKPPNNFPSESHEHWMTDRSKNWIDL